MSLLKYCAKTTVAAFACGMALSFGAWTLDGQVMDGAVTGVIDGDTIKIQLSSGPVLVRLAHIDAPELTQPGGRAAARSLHGRLLGEDISLHVVTQDRDQPIVAVVFLGEENINAWLVKHGYVWANRGLTQDADYCVWENAARSLKRGLWADKHWVAPWDWRMSKRDSLFFVSDYSNASAASCMREISQAPSLDE